LRIGVKFYPKGSSFKAALNSIDKSTLLAADQLGGDFVLPEDQTRKLAFIAGGIGITPFRSMIKYIVDTHESRSATLLYSERKASELAYTDVFNAAQHQTNMKIIYTLTTSDATDPDWMERGQITANMITTQIPDFTERLFYISGPHSMVSAIQDILRDLGVQSHNIKIDFFPGYA
jgi:ferredoxin-NADP reductase